MENGYKVTCINLLNKIKAKRQKEEYQLIHAEFLSLCRRGTIRNGLIYLLRVAKELKCLSFFELYNIMVIFKLDGESLKE